MAFSGFGSGPGFENSSGPLPPPSGNVSRAPSFSYGTGIQAKTVQFQDLKRSRSPALLSNDEDISRNSAQTTTGRFIESPPGWSNVQTAFLKDYGAHTHQSPAASSFISSGDSEVGIPDKLSQFHDLKRTRSPLLPSADEHSLRNSSQSVIGRHSLSTPTSDNWSMLSRSPHSPSVNQVFQGNPKLAQNEFKRLGARSNILFSTPSSQISERSSLPSHNINAEATRTKSSGFLVSKRTRSPPLSSANKVLRGNSYSTEDGTERELLAKAKRLARFKDELNETAQSSANIVNPKLFGNRDVPYRMERHNFVGEHSTEAMGDFANGNILSDIESLGSTNIIIGLCPDMCPESERAERERKGDLDQYERLDGDRNQTSQFLAIKKYNRTAEREADLIRPMPILQKTIDYLLGLLDRSYDGTFLGLYNFLWDRMRAIRMDLRMQHIFNVGAITMLEQMIRLHIIAMHEFCEFTKGEGFSEGFDAHLNIEQMNKTSVELFQMYDDHRKRGIHIPTEREFRGYYALLKLDKHPGYKVEPAELSLDLAKMTPEIRQAREVLFARDVARACRAGNFIAFFRLARKASYLQACLMHAHFAKLRTQALASLHSGLQNNQGLPVAHVTEWLGMEKEDIRGILEYHGFLIKEFEEPYMVKDGPFLNDNKDYPTKCSKLVHLKRSMRIFEDVSSFNPAASVLDEEGKVLQLDDVDEHDLAAVELVESGSSVPVFDEEMPDFEAISSPKDGMKISTFLKTSTSGQKVGDEQQVAALTFSPSDFSFAQNISESQSVEVGRVEKLYFEAPFGISPVKNVDSDVEATPLENVSSREKERSQGSQFYFSVENSEPQAAAKTSKALEDKEPTDTDLAVEYDEVMVIHDDEETAKAKLKLILRIWKRCASTRRLLREQRQIAANAALNLLSLGPSIRKNEDQVNDFGKFDIDHIMREQQEKRERSWSRLNVAELIVGELSRRNPVAKCLCWKLLVLSQIDQDKVGCQSQVAPLAAGPWLLSKLIPTMSGDDGDALVVSSPGVSVWKKWVPSQSSGDLICCFSVIKDTRFDSSNEAVLGASAVLFVVSETIPWNLQKARLDNLLGSLPSGSSLPLLILSGSYKNDISDLSSTIVNELRLHDIDKSRISRFLVVSLVGSQHMEQCCVFFSDEQLREGLQWLAGESPQQPALHCVKTRELVLTHLNSSLEVLDKMSIYEVGPDDCIRALNETLDQSMGKIAAAVSANPTGWPCPEMALLRNFGDDFRAMNWYLPSIGWSSSTRIEPLMHALRDCMLPPFCDDISWLVKGSHMGKALEHHRLLLENCLVRYMTHSCKIMGLALARKEAGIMLQKSAQLELRKLSYFIVPNWVMIFRRLFNWRLMSLSSGDISVSYILQQHCVSPTLESLDKMGVDESLSFPFCLSHPSLDEMLEVGRSPLLSRAGQSELEAFQPMPVISFSINDEIEEAPNVSNLVEPKISKHDGKFPDGGDDAYFADRVNNTGSELVIATSSEEASKLSKLLEQCNILQNRINEKLSIYF